MFFVIFWTALVRYTWLSNSSRFFSPTISTFGCFWSQWPTSLAVTSGREGVRTTSLSPTMRCWRLPSRSDVNKHQKTHQNQWHAIGYNCVFVSQPMSELHAGIVQVRTIIRVTILSDCFYHGRDRIRLVFWATWAFPDIQRKMLRDVERCWEISSVALKWDYFVLSNEPRNPELPQPKSAPSPSWDPQVTSKLNQDSNCWTLDPASLAKI